MSGSETSCIGKEYECCLRRSYETKIGDVTVLNLSKNPQYKMPLETLMTVARDRETGMMDFRRAVKEIYGSYIIPKFLETLPTRVKTITTGNNASYEGIEYFPQKIWAVDIPRAGTLPTEEFIDRLGNNLNLCGSGFKIQKAVIDIKRVEKEKEVGHDMRSITLPEYDCHPKSVPHSVVILDTMLATGGSCCAALLELYKHFRPHRVFTGHVVGAPEGIMKLARLLNNRICMKSEIVLAAVDEGLDEKKYIVPGLGDAGKRQCEE